MKDVVRRAILEAAEHVFAAQGYADAKMTEIAEQAGLAAGTLYNYFDNKERIFRALIEYRGEEFASRLEAIAARPGSARDRLVALTEGTLAYIESRAQMFQIFEQVGAQPDCGFKRSCGPGVDRARERYLHLHRKVFEQMAREKGAGCRPGWSPEELAVIFTGGVHALLRTWLRSPRKGASAEQHLNDRLRPAPLVDLFLQGATRKS